MQLKLPWTNLILAPIWFLLMIVFASIYFGAQGVSETDIPNKITENTPTMILVAQILLLATLLITTRRDNFNIFKDGWVADKSHAATDVVGGVVTGLVLAIGYFFVLAPLQTYLQRHVGDYVPAGETMASLGGQTLVFFIANVLLAPFVEESIYRNYALTRFSEKYSVTINIMVTTCMFGLLHWVGGFWYILMTGFFVGLPFAIIAMKRKTVIWVFTAHLTLNLAEFVYITMKH